MIRFLHLLGCGHAEQRECAAKHGAQGGSERESVGLALGTDNTIFCVVAVKGSRKLIGVGNKALWRELARGALCLFRKVENKSLQRARRFRIPYASALSRVRRGGCAGLREHTPRARMRVLEVGARVTRERN